MTETTEKHEIPVEFYVPQMLEDKFPNFANMVDPDLGVLVLYKNTPEFDLVISRTGELEGWQRFT